MAAFRLGGLLRLRRLQEDQAAAELARANARRRAAEVRRDASQEMLAQGLLPQHGDVLTFQAGVAARAAMTGLVGEAVIALQATTDHAGRATETWSDARTRAVTLSKLEDRHTASVQAEELRLEQLVLDEAAARRHLTAQDAPSTEENR